jgi:hypothetical protein
MEPTKELIDELYREEVRRAREMSPEEKLLAGAELFDMACQVTTAGIRHQHPGIDDARVRQILGERIALLRRLEASD